MDCSRRQTLSEIRMMLHDTIIIFNGIFVLNNATLLQQWAVTLAIFSATLKIHVISIGRHPNKVVPLSSPKGAQVREV